MPSLVQINTVINRGAVGRIAQSIHHQAREAGWESYVLFGRGSTGGIEGARRFGSRLGIYTHALATRLYDRHGLHSAGATDRLISILDDLKPDVIHLHNLHGYYLHYPRLIEYLRTINSRIVITIHDCWMLTGHCAYFELANCNRWVSGCHNCPERRSYPTSWFADRSSKNHAARQRAFLELNNTTLVPVSQWMSDRVAESFLSKFPRQVIYHGVNTDTFHPVHRVPQERKRILGVANVWDERKGLDEFTTLRRLLPMDKYDITLVGLTPRQIRHLPEGVSGLPVTRDANQLVALYASADVFVNPTRGDTLSMTNVEAQACGTPVVSYGAGGAPEGIAPNAGAVVRVGDVKAMVAAINRVSAHPEYRYVCRKWVEEKFDERNTFNQYLSLYQPD